MVFDCVLLIVTHVLPGMSLYNISVSYEQAGDLNRAIQCADEALRIWEAALPPGHEDVVAAMVRCQELKRARAQAFLQRFGVRVGV